MTNRMRVLTVPMVLILAACARGTPSEIPTGLPSSPTTTPYSLLVPAPGWITWERSGGIAGLCQQLTIQADGSYVFDDPCRSTVSQTGHLSQDEADRLQTWLATYQPYTWTSPAQPGAADIFTLKLRFHGSGSSPASEDVQSMIAMTIGQWASSLTASATHQPTLSSGQGIEGRATLGPSCLVARAEDPCPDKPFQGTLQILDADGGLVTEITTAADGSFVVALAPGEYTVQGVGGDPFPRAPRVDVTVTAGEFTQVTIPFDTGIR
jgi:hypothetical protein